LGAENAAKHAAQNGGVFRRMGVVIVIEVDIQARLAPLAFILSAHSSSSSFE
jgi:hypothetical protein